MIGSLRLDHRINEPVINWDVVVAIAEIDPSDLHLRQ